MTFIQIGIVVLVVAAVAIYFAPKLVEWREQIKDRVKPVMPTDPQGPTVPDALFEGKVRRLLMVRDLIRELDAVGAKGAVSKLRGAASMIVEEDFLA